MNTRVAAESRVVMEFKTVGTVVSLDVSKRNGYLYVLQHEPNRISVFHPEGKMVWKLELPFSVVPECMRLGPRDTNGFHPPTVLDAIHGVPTLALFPPGILPIVVDYLDDECMYLLDSTTSKMQVMDTENGHVIREWGEPGVNPGKLYEPGGFVLDGECGIIYIFDTPTSSWFTLARSTLQVFRLEGTFVQAMEKVTLPSRIMDIALKRKDGLIYLKTWRGILCIKTRDDEYYKTIGAAELGNREGGRGLVIDPNSRHLYVSGAHQRVIHEYDEHDQ